MQWYGPVVLRSGHLEGTVDSFHVKYQYYELS